MPRPPAERTCGCADANDPSEREPAVGVRLHQRGPGDAGLDVQAAVGVGDEAAGSAPAAARLSDGDVAGGDGDAVAAQPVDLRLKGVIWATYAVACPVRLLALKVLS